MSDYKVVPVEPTPEMEQAAEKYWNDRKFKALSDDPRTWKGLYAAMLAAAPAVQGEPVRISPRLRSVHSIILNALDRDAGEGRTIRSELADELRAAIAEQKSAPPSPPTAKEVRYEDALRAIQLG